MNEVLNLVLSGIQAERAVTNFPGWVLVAQLPLLRAWGYPSFVSNLIFGTQLWKGWHYSHQVQKLVALSSCKIPFFINYNLFTEIFFSNLYPQWSEAYLSHLPSGSPRWELKSNLFLFVLEESKGYLPIALVWYHRKSSSTWSISEAIGWGVLNL